MGAFDVMQQDCKSRISVGFSRKLREGFKSSNWVGASIWQIVSREACNLYVLIILLTRVSE